MIVGINKQKHKFLTERLEKLKELSQKSSNEEIIDEGKILETELVRLEDSLNQYDLLLQQLASSRDAYNSIYEDVSLNAYKFTRKVRKHT
ncbi:hypothetical protein [Dysgonomonas capnocytophagoides]|uniref:hypothetical protein n=1 Tax=Dysgonomonas capnocytophagoides TaxID=45254 RepID=UPI00291F882F|nr:hypothetical protein DCPSUM001_29170 [Dysgonomonas capnocytophagoides]